MFFIFFCFIFKWIFSFNIAATCTPITITLIVSCMLYFLCLLYDLCNKSAIFNRNNKNIYKYNQLFLAPVEIIYIFLYSFLCIYFIPPLIPFNLYTLTHTFSFQCQNTVVKKVHAISSQYLYVFLLFFLTKEFIYNWIKS